MTTLGEAEGTEGEAAHGERALAEELESFDPAELARTAARFAQDNPHAALAGALGVGFLLGGGLTPRLMVSLAVFVGRRYAAQAMREAVAGAIEPEAVTARP